MPVLVGMATSRTAAVRGSLRLRLVVKCDKGTVVLPQVKIKGEVLNRISFLYREVETPQEKIPNGSIVQILSHAGKSLGWGMYNGHARARLRVLSEAPDVEVNDQFFTERLEAAFSLRKSLSIPSDAYRLVNAEGDGLPGLVVDRFRDLFVIEYFASGMFKRRRLIQAVIQKHFPEAVFYSFSQRHVQKQESFDHYEEALPEPREITENAVRFLVRPGTGHKTGFFLDQRDNRKRVGELARDKRVLDLCCHSGGFSLYAMKHGARSVTAIDRDPIAIEQAQENAGLNSVAIDFRAQDIDSYLRENAGQRFDLIVLDPPKQTKSREGLHGALQRYLDWNTRALKMLNPGGLLVSCSCSGLVKDDMFRNVLNTAGRKAERKIEIIDWTSAGADHPVAPLAPETRYLKVGWVKVD